MKVMNRKKLMFAALLTATMTVLGAMENSENPPDKKLNARQQSRLPRGAAAARGRGRKAPARAMGVNTNAQYNNGTVAERKAALEKRKKLAEERRLQQEQAERERKAAAAAVDNKAQSGDVPPVVDVAELEQQIKDFRAALQLVSDDPVQTKAYNNKIAELQAEIEKIELKKKADAQAASQSSAEVKLPAVPLNNVGNTCYMNATLQCLTHTQPLVSAVFAGDFKDAVAVAFKNFLTNYKSGSLIVTPSGMHQAILKNCNGFVRGRQEDAHDLLAQLLDHLSTDNTIPTNVFGFDEASRFTCKTCGKSWQSNQPKDTTVKQFPKNATQQIMLKFITDEEKQAVSLTTLLSDFFKPVDLTGSEVVYCRGTCSDEKGPVKRDVTKKMILTSVPDVLLLTLCRFSVVQQARKVGDSFYAAKINTPVSFPLVDLNMQPYVQAADQPINYKLVGIVCHGGDTGGGHYTAYVLHGGTWYFCDDAASISSANAAVAALSKNGGAGPYILVYVKQ